MVHSPFRRRLGCLFCAIVLGWFAAHARAADEPIAAEGVSAP